MSNRKRRSFKQLTEMVEKFNRDYPVGTECVLYKDSGDKVNTRVTHAAIVMGFSTAVAWFEGVSGCYAIDRVGAPEDENLNPAKHCQQCKGLCPSGVLANGLCLDCAEYRSPEAQHKREFARALAKRGLISPEESL